MNLTDFIAKVRLVLDDPVDAEENPLQKWSDATIVSHATSQVRALARTQAERNQGFHNFEMILRGTQAKNPFGSVYQWTLPPWVMRIVSVRRIAGSIATTGTDTFSPHLWTTPVAIGDWVCQAERGSGYGWLFDGNRALRIIGEGSAPDLYVEMAKLPAELFKATLDLGAATTTRLRLPSTLTLGTDDLNEGSLINAEVQVKSVTNPAVNVQCVGITSRVVYSRSNQIVSTNSDNDRRTEIYLENALPKLLMVDDVIESVIPIQDEHLELLRLRVANSCLAQMGNLPAQRALAKMLDQEELAYNNHVTPRNASEAGQWREPEPRFRTFDDDRALPRDWMA